MKNIVILFSWCLLLGSNACKKGCTNAKAFNYNSAAKEDDASCQFCDSTIIDRYFASYSEVDENSSGPHAFQNVLNITAQGELRIFTGNACKLYGLEPNCGSNSFGSFANLYTELRNGTNDTMIASGSFRLSISGSSSNNLISVSNMTIPPLSTQRLSPQYDVFIDCLGANFASASISSVSFNFQYK